MLRKTGAQHQGWKSYGCQVSQLRRHRIADTATKASPPVTDCTHLCCRATRTSPRTFRPHLKVQRISKESLVHKIKWAVSCHRQVFQNNKSRKKINVWQTRARSMTLLFTIYVLWFLCVYYYCFVFFPPCPICFRLTRVFL